MSKYEFNPDPFSMHTKVVQLTKNSQNVLDVGCADGYLSEKILSNECEVVGIEIDLKAAKNAKKYCKEVICGDAEFIELSEEYKKYFSVIVFADILEHLKDPLAVLKRYKKYLKDDGYIIVSLPNISNWRMRFKFLFGNFEYEDKGLLDEGHLRFFNEKSAKKLLTDAGYVICKFDLTVGDIPKFPEIFHFIGKIWPNFLAYQFFIVAKKIN